MRKDLEAKLVEDFPSLFRDYGGDPRETCMAWGVAVGDGWYEIMYRLCERIMHTPCAETFKFEQIKEKFGELRIYSSGGSKEAGRLVGEAENLSRKTCESCGTQENVTCESKTKFGWIQTLCDKCRQ